MLTKPRDLASHGGSISNDFGKIPFLREPRKISPKVSRKFNKSSVLSKTAANSFNFVLWRLIKNNFKLHSRILNINFLK